MVNWWVYRVLAVSVSFDGSYIMLRRILSACLVFAGKKDQRYYLNGIHVDNTSGELVIESSDGHMAIQCVVVNPEITAMFNPDTNVILTRQSVEAALKLNKNLIIKDLTCGCISFELHDARYPDIMRATERAINLRNPPAREKGVDVSLLKQACDGMSKLFTSKKMNCVATTQTGANECLKWARTFDGFSFTAYLMPTRL